MGAAVDRLGGRRVVGTGEGEDFLVEGGGQGYGQVVVAVFVGWFFQWVYRRWEVTQAVSDPAIQNTRVPSSVEWAASEGFGRRFARGPQVTTVGRQLRGVVDGIFLVSEAGGGGGGGGNGGGIPELRWFLLDDRVKKDEGVQESRVDQ